MNSRAENEHPTAKYWIDKWPYHPMPWEIAVITSVVSGLLAVLGVVSNGLVMYLVCQIQEVQNMDILILSLCFSDFLSSIVVQPQLIPRILSRSRVPAEQSLSLHISTHFTLVAGSLSLLFITLNRYLSLKFPFFYVKHVTEKKTYGCVVTIFLAAFGMIIWVLLHGELESATFPVIVSIIVSFTLLFQIMIFIIVQAQNRNMRRQITAVQHNQRESDASHMTRRTDAQRSKANRTILYICAVFVATWLPSIIFRVSYVVHGNLTFYIQWVHIFNVVLQLHSCINPFLYVLRSSRVKQVLIRIIRRY